MPQTLETTEISEITSPFQFNSTENIGDPMAPLVSAHRVESSNDVILNIVIFIPTNSNDIELVEQKPEGDTLHCTVNYAFNEGEPNEYKAYFMQHICENFSSSMSKIEVFLHQDDPKTSRGTVTTVQTS